MTILPELQSFEESVTKILQEVKIEKEIVKRIKPHLKALLQTKGLLPEKYREPKPEKYSQYLLYQPENRSFSIVAFVWGPGHTAPIHDHLTWGLVGIFEGTIEETRYKKVLTEKDGFSLKIIEKVVAEKNDISFVYPPQADIHSVRNPFANKAVSIHVYGKDIGTLQRHLYQGETFTVSPIVTKHDNKSAIYS